MAVFDWRCQRWSLSLPVGKITYVHLQQLNTSEFSAGLCLLEYILHIFRLCPLSFCLPFTLEFCFHGCLLQTLGNSCRCLSAHFQLHRPTLGKPVLANIVAMLQAQELQLPNPLLVAVVREGCAHSATLLLWRKLSVCFILLVSSLWQNRFKYV